MTILKVLNSELFVLIVLLPITAILMNTAPLTPIIPSLFAPKESFPVLILFDLLNLLMFVLLSVFSKLVLFE